MSTTRTFKDLVDEAKEQLDRGEVFERGRRLQASGKCDKTARGLQAKLDEITATYLEDVPESFDDLEIMMLYIQELREVIDELKVDIDTVREYGRRYWLTEYAGNNERGDQDMKNVCLQKWDNGRPGSGYGEVFAAPCDFRPEDVTGDYDEVEIREFGRVVYRKVNGIVVYDEREKGDQDMSTRTFNDLVDEAKEQLDREETYEIHEEMDYRRKCDKMARGLQAKLDEITATYLEDVPESFDDLEIMMLYIQELREVIDELKVDIDTVREYGRRYWLTEYARAIIREADDVVKDLIFERSAAERAYDIVAAMLVHPEEEDAEKDELDMFLDMFFKNDPDGADKLREAAERLEASYEKHEP